MASFETVLNNAIESHGFRISPRLGLVDRATRYIKMIRAERGEFISDEDAQMAASLIMMSHNKDVEMQECDGEYLDENTCTTPRRSSRLRARERETEETTTPRRSSRLHERETEETTTLRRSSRLSNRPSFIEPVRVVSNTNNGLRVTVNTHPMVRRSQVSRS